MKRKLPIGVLLISLALIGHASPAMSPASAQAGLLPLQFVTPGACSSFCLDNGDHCVFGTNFDNSFENGLLLVNKRHVLKTTWDPSTSGEYARWISRYGSVTVNLLGYQMAWAGMNEAGLMISTMGLSGTRVPTPDERPPFPSPFWMQYQLDNHSTVDQVIASHAEIGLAESTVDHYLVCDRNGECATIEFLEGKLVYHTGESLPARALTNSTYRESVSTWEQSELHVDLQNENSLWRFTVAANRDGAFEPSTSDAAVTYSFDTLQTVSGENTVWSFVYDPVHLRVHFRTTHNPNIRYLDFSSLDFSCQSQVMMLDVHTDVSGDISDDLVAYTHDASFKHSNGFFTEYEGLSMSPILVDTLLWGLESFPCQEVESASQGSLTHYHPRIPPRIIWVGLTALHRLWPVWALLVSLSLAYLFWRMAADRPTSMSEYLLWVLVTILLGPFGLLAYLLIRRRTSRMVRTT